MMWNTRVSSAFEFGLAFKEKIKKNKVDVSFEMQNQAGRQANRQTVRKTDRQTYIRTGR